jgi:transcriptional regulator EpsA
LSPSQTAPPVETAGAADTHDTASSDARFLDMRQAEALVRLVEAAPQVRRRYQFFVWSQSQLFPLLPHDLLVCGAYQRQRRALVLEAFHSVVYSRECLRLLTDADGALQRALAAAWIEARCRPVLVEPDRLQGLSAAERALLAQEHGLHKLLVHGSSRPQRPAEIESLFVLGGLQGEAAQHMRHVELLLPHLPLPAVQRRQPEAAATRKGITDRERQILTWVRDGKNNQQIGAVLGISPLTVKNHIQKILRKLGATNRAQAVAQAMALDFLDAPAKRS